MSQQLDDALDPMRREKVLKLTPHFSELWIVKTQQHKKHTEFVFSIGECTLHILGSLTMIFVCERYIRFSWGGPVARFCQLNRHGDWAHTASLDKATPHSRICLIFSLLRCQCLETRNYSWAERHAYLAKDSSPPHLSHFFFSAVILLVSNLIPRDESLFGFILCVNIPTSARERERKHSRISSRVRTHPNSISMYHCGVVSLCSRASSLGSLMCAILGAFPLFLPFVDT